MSELFDGASDYGSSGIDSLAQAQDAYSNQGTSFGPPQNTDQQAEQVIQNILGNVGNRSNVRGSTNYNPIFAQALNMSRGLQPGNRVAGDYFGADNFQGISDLARPSYLQPQVVGEKGMYFSPAERGIQETLPEMIRSYQENFTIGGILDKLINKGEDVYEKGKSLYDKTFGDTPFRRFNYDNEQQNKVPVGIMENMDRAEMTDVQRAIMAGFDNSRLNPVQIDPNLQTAGLNLDDLQKFVTSPGVVGKALDYAQPYIQNLLPDNVNVDTGLIYNQEKPEDSYTGIKFTIPFSTG